MANGAPTSGERHLRTGRRRIQAFRLDEPPVGAEPARRHPRKGVEPSALRGEVLTDNKGLATFTDVITSGVHTLTIKDVVKSGNIYDPTRNKISNNQSTYTVDNNYVYIFDFGFSYTSAKGKNPASLQGSFTIYDQSDTKISGVVIGAIWEYNGVNASQIVYSQATDNKGVTSVSYGSPASGTYKLYVTNVTLINYDYKSTSDNFIFPQTYTLPLLKMELSTSNSNALSGSFTHLNTNAINYINNLNDNSISTNNIVNHFSCLELKYFIFSLL